ncbi:hypothetical protein J7K76_00165 [Candidatus Bipolaricaulota bacterium]|nr:hypothetical protein [Candidatus Bipolaricaulota bacterium]
METVAYVNRDALPAGALIAISCDGAMGAAPEKVVSAVRETFRAAAEARGRNPDVAAAMVDPDIGIPDLVKEGKILTPSSAAAWGYSDGTAEGLAEVLAAEGLADAAVEEFAPGFWERTIALLTSPTASGILIALGILGPPLVLREGPLPDPEEGQSR